MQMGSILNNRYSVVSSAKTLCAIQTDDIWRRIQPKTYAGTCGGRESQETNLIIFHPKKSILMHFIRIDHHYMLSFIRKHQKRITSNDSKKPKID